MYVSTTSTAWQVKSNFKKDDKILEQAKLKVETSREYAKILLIVRFRSFSKWYPGV